MEYKSFYKQVGGNEGNKCYHNTRLDTYGCGCQHDCSYCYAKSLLDFRGLWKPETPAVADINKIRRKVAKLPKELIRLGGMTDCFQPLELIEYIGQIKDKRITVCEDEDEAYDYWKTNFNPNKDDCCDLRR